MAAALPPLLSVRALVQLYGVGARVQLGQNFLFDGNVTGKRPATSPLTPTGVDLPTASSLDMLCLVL